MRAFPLLLGVSACAVSPPAPPSPVRILVEFQAPVDGAAPALLARMERLAGSPLRYAASVSEKLHAYWLSCSAADPECAGAVRSLRRDSEVRDISFDQPRKPTPASR